MKVLGIDFESQGLEVELVAITEAAAILVDSDAYRDESLPRVLGKVGALCYSPEHLPQTQKLIDLTGITDEMLKKDGVHPANVIAEIIPLMAQADVVVAHKKAFDQGIFQAQARKWGLTIPGTPWLCTYTEVPYPDKYRCKQLAHLAFDHGLKMDHRDLHRATDDVELMLELLLTQYKIEDVLAYASEPWVYLKAEILGPWVGNGGDGGVGKLAATGLGYGWESPRAGPPMSFGKTWVKGVKASRVEAERALAEEAGFTARVLSHAR